MSVALVSGGERSSWTKLKAEHERSLKMISNYREEEKNKSKNSRCKASIEVAGSMQSNLKETIKDLEKRCLYEFNTASKDSISKAILTDRQRQIVELRQHHTIAEIASKLNLSKQTVFETFKQGIVKIEKYLKLEDKELSVLSPQQRKIHNMAKLGKTNNEIMQELNMKRNTFHMQKKRIDEKLKLVSTKS